MKIILLRHGQTEGNAAGRYIGKTDEPLSKEGAAALRKAASFDEITQVFVSPMLRCRQSAKLLFPTARQEIVDGLKEMDFGYFEGRTADEMSFDSAYRVWVEGSCLTACPGGESTEEFCMRTCEAFTRIIDTVIVRSEESIIIIAHGGSIMAIMQRYAKPEHGFHHWHVKPGGGYSAYLDEKAWPESTFLTHYEKLEAPRL